MATMKTVGVKELKNNLSAYLREVRRGVRILVSDRNTIVAEIHEPRTGYAPADPADPILAEWTETGIIRPATAKKRDLPPSPVTVPDGTALRLLDQDRGDAEE